ncbi:MULTISPECIES: acyltransferase family protein [Henriciella]|uniref:Acyltransferase n=1 Tax=Henriciella marina TaxID=453851 RepID=A0ABT4LZF3_9PROT|nr:MULTISPECIES: acyltransferase [Henriciella]MCH2457271.1 acyltransferase [Henriciella sp.]MCZ4299513.1 acyltransferase [Henriciella marina]
MSNVANQSGLWADPLFGANHFTLLRWGLALGVVVGHAWLIPTGYEPTRIHDWTLSYLAVNGFFILSGLLIAKSLEMRKDVKGYARSRLLRIYPALIVLMLALLFFFGPAFSNPGGIRYLVDSEPWTYVLRVLLMGDPLSAPGGVFGMSSDPVFNGALWTIRYEMLAYVLAGIGFFSGFLKNRWRVLTSLLISQLFYLVLQHASILNDAPDGVVALFRFTTAFLLGMTLWHFPVLRRAGWLSICVAIGSFLLLGRTPIGETLANITLAAGLMHFGLVRSASRTIATMPDYSYGIYIWHYPVLQSVLLLNPDMHPVALLAVSAPPVILAAAASWHVIEKPALQLKKRRRTTGRLGER